MSELAPANDVRATEPFDRYVRRRGPTGSLWVGSFVDGALVGSVTAKLTRTRLDVAVDSQSVVMDPGLLPALCDWSAAQAVNRVVAAVAGACNGSPVVVAGFAPGADFVTYARPLTRQDALLRPSTHVREVAVADHEVARLAAAGLPHSSPRYRPSGMDVLAATVGDPQARAWVVGTPGVGCIVTHVTGDVGVVALIVCLSSSAGRISDDLLAAALPAMSRDGAKAMHSIVEATNTPSRNLNLRYGMTQNGCGTWWHRSPVT